jgi:hypothetical protein
VDATENARGSTGQFLTLLLVLTVPAVARDVEVSSRDVNASLLAELTLDLSDQAGVKLNYLAAALTREVIVRLALHGFIVTVAFAKTMLLYQLHLLEQGKGAVHRRQAEVGGTLPGSVIHCIRL